MSVAAVVPAAGRGVRLGPGPPKALRRIGGHPLLVQTCTDAVKEWKFVPAPEESTQVVEFDFTGGGSSN